MFRYFHGTQNWVASDLSISNGQQDNHVGLVLEVRSTFVPYEKYNKIFGQLNRLFSVTSSGYNDCELYFQAQ